MPFYQSLEFKLLKPDDCRDDSHLREAPQMFLRDGGGSNDDSIDQYLEQDDPVQYRRVASRAGVVRRHRGRNALSPGDP